MRDPGLDRHEWETEWEALQPELQDSPGESLPGLGDLVGRMLAEEGVPVDEDRDVAEEGVEPELVQNFQEARRITRRLESGEDVDPGDVGSAVDLYRQIYEHLATQLHE